MVSVVEALAILHDPVYANLEPLAEEKLGAGTVSQLAMGGVRDKLPVHCFLAVEKVAVEDEAERLVLFVVRLGDA